MSKGQRWINDARMVLEVARDPNHAEVYVIGGPDEARVTLYAQQCRALNLVCALRETDPALEDGSIAIVGAGAAGMTAAAALHAVGVPATNLHVFERAARPLYTQWASYTRFLHPRLFHWPEAGWDDGQAGFPAGDWSAAVAHAVRDQIVGDVADVPIRFCTEVTALHSRNGGPVRLTSRGLGRPYPRQHRFDRVLVATGFPVERAVPGVHGGTYWHAIDGLETLRHDVHVVGDGDGALTEVLMLLIDRFGHGAVEVLCSQLQTDHRPDLDRADLEAQGTPGERHNPDRAHVETPWVRRLFGLLAGLSGPRPEITVHATNPLSGSSFLLNRALVSHLTWTNPPVVRLQDEPAHIIEASAPGLGAHVIWRVGVGAHAPRPLARAALTTKGTIRNLAVAGQVGAFQAGLVTALIDNLRRPLWTEEAAIDLRAARGLPRWDAPPIGTPAQVPAVRPTPLAGATLRTIAATVAALRKAGWSEPLSTLDETGRPWYGIDVLARAASRGHADLVQGRRSMRIGTAATVRHVLATSAGDTDGQPTLGVDRVGRLWFRPIDDPDTAEPSRAAVSALVDPEGVGAWARELAQQGARRPDRGPHLREPVPLAVLRGLGDVGAHDPQTQLVLAALHEQHGDWEGVRTAYFRAGRAPAGERSDQGSRLRRALTGLAEAMARMLRPSREQAGRDEDRRIEDEHVAWMLMTAAAAQLGTLSGRGVVELAPSARYLAQEWVPSLFRLQALTVAGEADADALGRPRWADDLARRGSFLGPVIDRDPAFDLGVDRQRFVELRDLADTALRTAYLETPDDGRLTLADFGVWPADVGRDHLAGEHE